MSPPESGEPWRYEFLSIEWEEMSVNPMRIDCSKYRRKLKTHTIKGVEIPDLRINPKNGGQYWYPDASSETLVSRGICRHETTADSRRLTNDPYYKLSEEGKQAAILHTKAWLGYSTK